ncbi:hypothetical protein Acor_31300 [Acrocarpospora corrugata]|uniref:DUF4326 domain-containing protein n=1 Tax=Acrocarpospora corrugata TaxID=35763 RepID=A0A5M3VX35_9ACTN|nr:DUF4326 domain-containing protein [Acrocarpospora corrugata]GES01066.1 hypothetical protein Acor_31300 [Acrocarpospora corrugata]
MAPPSVEDWSDHERSRLVALLGGETVLVSMNQRRGHPRLIAWAKSQGLYVRIDSRSVWGNPHEKDDVLRGEQLRRYEAHLDARPVLIARLGELRGKALACWCTHGPCHGQILKLRADGPAQPPVQAEPDDLSGEEKLALAEAETAIERGLTTFVDVGHALSRIRAGRLHRATHVRFEDYCRERWGFTKNHVNRQIDAAHVMDSLAITHIPRQQDHRPAVPPASAPPPTISSSPTTIPNPTKPHDSSRLGQRSGLRDPTPPPARPEIIRIPGSRSPSPPPTHPALTSHPPKEATAEAAAHPSLAAEAQSPQLQSTEPDPGPTRRLDDFVAALSDHPALIGNTEGFEKEASPEQAEQWSRQLAEAISRLQELQRRIETFLDPHD